MSASATAIAKAKPGSLIFITGSSGFIGAQVVRLALEDGYRTRLAVRRRDQIADIRSRYPGHEDQLDFAVIPDLADVAALTAALVGAHYVIHVASPMPGKTATDLHRDFIDPAVKNTTSLLDAAAASPSVRRVVITASALSLIPLGGLRMPGVVAAEGANRKWEIDEAAANADASGFDKYHASKLLAHRATLDWVESHGKRAKDGLSFEVAAVLPTFVLGTDLTQKGPEPQGVNGILWQSLAMEHPLMPPMIVDVCDVAAVHVRALTTEDLTPGAVTEFIADGRHTTWEQIIGIIKDKYPAVDIKLVGPFPEAAQSDTARAERDLGIKWRPVEDVISSVLDQQLALQGKA